METNPPPPNRMQQVCTGLQTPYLGTRSMGPDGTPGHFEWMTYGQVLSRPSPFHDEVVEIWRMEQAPDLAGVPRELMPGDTFSWLTTFSVTHRTGPPQRV